MNFFLAETFTASLTRLTGAEQKAVKITALDLRLDPSAPGMALHRIDRARDPNFWSARVNADLRLIIHRLPGSFMLCYVGHHDDAYAWAERRRVERHQTTGAMQLVELRERVEEVTIHVRAAADVSQARYYPPLFLKLTEGDLLGIGVPPDWVQAVWGTSELNFFNLTEHLPEEAMEALINYVTTGELTASPVASLDADPFLHPDAQRRFRILDNVDELAAALDWPWDRWAIFLHPTQRGYVERTYNGPARICGSAGTGKTVVALHRAAHLARTQPDTRVLLATFSKTLAAALEIKLNRLVSTEPEVAARIRVTALPDFALELAGGPRIAEDATVLDLLTKAAADVGETRFVPRFLFSEWRDVVDAWDVRDLAAYLNVPRLGRKTRIGPKQREALWTVFAHVRAALDQSGLVTWPAIYAKIAANAARMAPFDFAVIDEAQDLGVPQLRFIAALGSARPDALFFAGDLGQRIFQTPLSWRSLGIELRGRSHSLKINYRTSHQIRSQADLLLPEAISDVDGLIENRNGTISLFDGPPPELRLYKDTDAEAEGVALWLTELVEEGVPIEDIALFVRCDSQFDRAAMAANAAGYSHRRLNELNGPDPGGLAIGTMHNAKGLEFRAVVVMACDEDILPLQSRLEAAGDDSDLKEFYDTERHLLYVACTRARDHLLVTAVEPGSEFLLDFSDTSQA